MQLAVAALEVAEASGAVRMWPHVVCVFVCVIAGCAMTTVHWTHILCLYTVGRVWLTTCVHVCSTVCLWLTVCVCLCVCLHILCSQSLHLMGPPAGHGWSHGHSVQELLLLT